MISIDSAPKLGWRSAYSVTMRTSSGGSPGSHSSGGRARPRRARSPSSPSPCRRHGSSSRSGIGHQRGGVVPVLLEAGAAAEELELDDEPEADDGAAQPPHQLHGGRGRAAGG